MNKRIKKSNKKEVKIEPKDETAQIQESLENEESQLRLEYEMLQATAEFWAKKMDVLIKKHNYLEKHSNFSNDGELEKVSNQIQHLLRKAEFEQNEALKTEKKQNKLEEKKKNFIFKNISKQLGSVIFHN